MSNTILGDLSYKTAGSQYKQSGVFEVVKAEAEDLVGGGPSSSTGGDGEGTSGTAEGQKSSLKVGKLHDHSTTCPHISLYPWIGILFLKNMFIIS